MSTARPALGARFLTVWVGQTVSAIGSMLSGVGISVWVFLETGSAAWLGALIALSGAPTVLLTPFMRSIDRVSRRTVMIAGDLVSAVSALGILALALSDRLEIWHLAIAAVVSGAGGAFQMPAFHAAIPQLVDRAALGRANGLNQFGPALGITVGPLIAAPLVAWWGIEAVAAADLVTFGVAVVTTAAVRFDEVENEDGPADAGDDGSWRSTWTWLLRGPGRPLVTLLSTMAVVNFVLAGFNVAVLALAVELGGAGGAGLPLAMGGAAMIVGSLIVGAVGIPARRVRAFAIGLAVFAVGASVAAVRPSLFVLTLGIVIGLLAVPIVNAAMSTLFHEHVPQTMQGRVFAARAAIGGSLGPIGSVSIGALIAVIAEPAMAADGIGGRTVGRLIGVGDDRGPALVLLFSGVALLALAARLASSWIVGELDRPAEVAPTPISA